MEVTVSDAKDRLPELIDAVEHGDQVVITREGKPVAQIAPPPVMPERRKVRYDTMQGRIHMKPGWDDPITVDQFLSGEY